MHLCFISAHGHVSLAHLDEAPPILELGEAIEDDDGNSYPLDGPYRIMERLTPAAGPVDGIVVYEEVCRR